MSSFTLHEVAFGKEVLCSEWLKAELVRRAELVMARAIATAPVDPHHDPEKGVPYKEAFKVRSGLRPKGFDPALDRSFRTERAYAQVVNTKSYARHIEYGTGRGRAGRTDRRHTPRFRVLGRALSAAKG